MTRDEIERLIEENAENTADSTTLADRVRIRDGGGT